jgi:hypothetical protein
MTDNSEPNTNPPSLADLSEKDREKILRRIDEAGAEGWALGQDGPTLDPESDDPLGDLLEGGPES